jgi:hypothetical protein
MLTVLLLNLVLYSVHRYISILTPSALNAVVPYRVSIPIYLIEDIWLCSSSSVHVTVVCASPRQSNACTLICSMFGFTITRYVYAPKVWKPLRRTILSCIASFFHIVDKSSWSRRGQWLTQTCLRTQITYGACSIVLTSVNDTRSKITYFVLCSRHRLYHPVHNLSAPVRLNGHVWNFVHDPHNDRFCHVGEIVLLRCYIGASFQRSYWGTQRTFLIIVASLITVVKLYATISSFV